jgi:hypothetical protein
MNCLVLIYRYASCTGIWMEGFKDWRGAEREWKMSGWGKLVSFRKDHLHKGRDGASACGSKGLNPFPLSTLFRTCSLTQHLIFLHACLNPTTNLDVPEYSDYGLDLPCLV